jgi:hypothetical protein
MASAIGRWTHEEVTLLIWLWCEGPRKMPLLTSTFNDYNINDQNKGARTRNAIQNKLKNLRRDARIRSASENAGTCHNLGMLPTLHIRTMLSQKLDDTANEFLQRVAQKINWDLEDWMIPIVSSRSDHASPRRPNFKVCLARSIKERSQRLNF